MEEEQVTVTQKCKQHKKDIEVFCWTDRAMLCLNCILQNQDHRHHELLSFEQTEEKLSDLRSMIGADIEKVK